METVKILLIAIGGYGANYMKELTEKNVTNAKIEGIWCPIILCIPPKPRYTLTSTYSHHLHTRFQS